MFDKCSSPVYGEEPKLWGKNKTCQIAQLLLDLLAERTGLEPATLGVTGRYSNQLNYRSKIHRVTQHHTSLQLPEESGVPRGIRTPVLTVKG